MEIALLVIRLALFGVFSVAAVGKLLDPEGSRKAMNGFGIPAPLVEPVIWLLPIAEIVFAICLLFVGTSWLGAVGALLLLVAFIGGMLVQMMKGKAPDCHCFGQIHSEPVGAKSVVRNVVIAILPIVLIIAGRENQGLPLGETSAEITTNAVLAIVSIITFIAFTMLISRSRELAELKRRVELIELLDSSGTVVEREAAGSTSDSLPIGAPVPQFSHPNAEGQTVSEAGFFSKQRHTLAVFVSPSCGPCGAMVPNITKWMEEFAGKLDLVFFSKGTAEENRAKFGDAIVSKMVFQNDTETGKKYFVRWTPTALLISPDGRIASRPAIGDSAIGDLVTTLRNAELSSPDYFVVNGSKPGRVNIGGAVPPFELPTAADSSITADDLAGSKTLAIFITTSCPHCAELVEDIREWETSESRNGFYTVLFSEGDVETHKAYRLTTPIILDDEYKVAMELGMFGAPSAVLIDENGRIASETAVGASMIWSLIGRETE